MLPFALIRWAAYEGRIWRCRCFFRTCLRRADGRQALFRCHPHPPADLMENIVPARTRAWGPAYASRCRRSRIAFTQLSTDTLCPGRTATQRAACGPAWDSSSLDVRVRQSSASGRHAGRKPFSPARFGSHFLLEGASAWPTAISCNRFMKYSSRSCSNIASFSSGRAQVAE